MTLARLSAVLINRYAWNPVTKGGTEVLCFTVKRILEQLRWHHESTEMVTVSEIRVSVSENCANVVIYIPRSVM